MKGRSDKERFTILFEWVARALQKRFTNVADRRDTEKVYFLALEDLAIDVVEAAAVVICKEGTSDGWFPKTPEWIDIAIGLQVSWQLESLRRQRALAPSAEQVEADLVRLRAARDRLVVYCRKRGYEDMAVFFERYKINHPSTDRDAPFCPKCADTGSRPFAEDDGLVNTCDCHDTNPVLQARRLEAGRDQRLSTRRKRAANLNPRRAEALLSP